MIAISMHLLDNHFWVDFHAICFKFNGSTLTFTILNTQMAFTFRLMLVSKAEINYKIK